MDISLHLLEVTVRDQFFFTEFAFTFVLYVVENKPNCCYYFVGPNVSGIQDSNFARSYTWLSRL